MSKGKSCIGSSGGRLALALAGLLLGSASAAQPGPERQQELLHLLRHDCGSCHGMQLKGGLGPPLLPEALTDKPAEMLRATILIGRAGTPMPPWWGILSEAEAEWLVNLLKEGVPR